jgi:hypothetical protein
MKSVQHSAPKMVAKGRIDTVPNGRVDFTHIQDTVRCLRPSLDLKFFGQSPKNFCG